jgi:GlpG protein
MSGPLFVGLSGVIYALLGYVWVQSRYGMNNTYHIEPQTMVFMMIWLAICVVGIIPQVANTEHVVGLLLGGGLAALRTKAWKIWFKKKKF